MSRTHSGSWRKASASLRGLRERKTSIDKALIIIICTEQGRYINVDSYNKGECREYPLRRSRRTDEQQGIGDRLWPPVHEEPQAGRDDHASAIEIHYAQQDYGGSALDERERARTPP